MVDIYVGPKRKRYHWHTKLVCHLSPHLNTIFDDKNNEATKSGLFLLGEEAETFDLLATWFYRGTLAPIPIEFREPINKVYLNLYKLAEEWSMRPLENLTMTCIQQYFRESELTAELGFISEVYAVTPKASLLRLFLARQTAFQITMGGMGYEKDWIEKMDLDGEFTVDVINCLRVVIRNFWTIHPNPALDADCTYHNHTSIDGLKQGNGDK